MPSSISTWNVRNPCCKTLMVVTELQCWGRFRAIARTCCDAAAVVRRWVGLLLPGSKLPAPRLGSANCSGSMDSRPGYCYYCYTAPCFVPPASGKICTNMTPGHQHFIHLLCDWHRKASSKKWRICSIPPIQKLQKQKVSTNSNIIIHCKDKIAIKLSYVWELFLSAFSFNTDLNEVGQAQLMQAPATAECSI